MGPKLSLIQRVKLKEKLKARAEAVDGEIISMDPDPLHKLEITNIESKDNKSEDIN